VFLPDISYHFLLFVLMFFFPPAFNNGNVFSHNPFYQYLPPFRPFLFMVKVVLKSARLPPCKDHWEPSTFPRFSFFSLGLLKQPRDLVLITSLLLFQKNPCVPSQSPPNHTLTDVYFLLRRPHFTYLTPPPFLCLLIDLNFFLLLYFFTHHLFSFFKPYNVYLVETAPPRLHFSPSSPR